MPLIVSANELNLCQQVDKNKKDIAEVSTKVNNYDSQIESIKDVTTKLNNNYTSEYHLVETIEYQLDASQFDNLTKSVTLENENFKLLDALISWCPVGSLENVNVIAEANIVLLEQTEEGKITFACENIPRSAINLKVIVNLLGNY